MVGKLKILLLLATMVAQSVSTSTAPPSASTSRPNRPSVLVTLGKELGLTREELICKVNEMPNQLKVVLQDFSLKLMEKFMNDPKINVKNIVFSPYSIHLIMTMILAGVEKETESRRQLIEALGYGDDANAGKCVFNYRRLLDYFYFTEDTGVKQADKMFLYPRFRIHPTYNIFTEGFFRSTVGALESDSDKAVNQINDFVKAKTDGRIQDILKPGSLSPLDVMVLVDAISHTGKWMFEFDETVPMTFNRIGGQTSFEHPDGMVMKENKKLRYLYSQGLGAQFVELPYKKDLVRMIIGLPSENTWEALQKVATGFRYEDLEHKFSCVREGVKVTMPQLKTTFDESMIDTMKKMGVKDIFSDAAAKLKYITSKILAVSKIFHQAAIEVNRHGSTASAGTVAVACTRDTFVNLIFDRPFFITIMDTKYGTPLFSGIILDPSQ